TNSPLPGSRGRERDAKALESVSTSRTRRSEVMMRMGKSMMLGAALVLAACGGTGNGVDDTEYVEATPDLSGTALEINGEAAAEEGAALIAEGFEAREDELNGQGPEFLEQARLQVRALNSALKEAIAP